MKNSLLFSMAFCINLFAQNVEWGWEVHRYINDHAVDFLPAEMSFFQDHRQFLRDHSVDPDTDPLPGYYITISILIIIRHFLQGHFLMIGMLWFPHMAYQLFRIMVSFPGLLNGGRIV